MYVHVFCFTVNVLKTDSSCCRYFLCVVTSCFQCCVFLYVLRQVSAIDFAARLLFWTQRGFPELGDYAGCGIGATTMKVLRHPLYNEDPHSVRVSRARNFFRCN